MSRNLPGEYDIHQDRVTLELREGICGHCGFAVEFKIPEGGGGLSHGHVLADPEDEHAWAAVEHQFLIGICRRKGCGKPTVLYRTLIEHGHRYTEDTPDDEVRIEILYPRGGGRRTDLPLEVPQRLRDWYVEAARVEYLSPNSAAFLCGRMLEQALREQLGKQKGMLAKLIEQFQQSQNPPPALAELMEVIRGFRNIASHAGQDDAGDWVNVDAAEAAYLLDVIPQLFHFIYVQPELARQMKARLDAKSDGKAVGPILTTPFVVEPADPVPQSPEKAPWDDAEDLPF